ncbi:hypothetical protein [Pontibacter harenae]|uniref:hypothetical protein n=1 Tax=Pontibacter harenae TaxID=2894083 RepID=UPI001E4439B5|nr:hypothetical protein [Pontibacter harenae]MCC9166044.1 hypothetical protein [Pontibacter harenae]
MHTVQQVPPPTTTIATTPNYADSTIVIAAGTHYNRSKLHTFFYGKHYRPTWTTPVEVNVLDIGTAKGGLSPIKQGGSRQTINLRLEDSTGTEYVLRSVDKEPASSLPEWLQQSYIADIVRDATSATHPYAALTIHGMAEAIGIYHVVPELVYVPHDARLGEFEKNIGGMLAILERRPNGDQSDNPRMGYAPDVKSTRSMLEHRLAHNDNGIDERMFLRARLFDMLIGDWSRHEDNWRWAKFEKEKGLTYKPVPRDRDNVYYKLNDAPIPWLFMKLGFKSQYHTYRHNLTDVKDLNRSGRNLDEIILGDLEFSEWQEIADSVKHELTDEVIEKAFRSMPDTIYKLSAGPIIAKLKSRRDQLNRVAKDYYNELSDKVYVVGSDKHEKFLIEVLSREEVRVRKYKISKEGEERLLLSDKVYSARVTDKIQLYGLGGDDHFIVTGSVKPKIKILLWGGAGEDTYTIAEENKKAGKRVKINDTQYRNTYDVTKSVSVDIDDDLRAKEFDAQGWLLRYYLD